MRRRVWLLTVLVLSLVVVAAGLAGPAGAGPNDPTVLFGARPEPGTQQGTTALEADIRAWIETWNQDPRPFVWTKTAEEILGSLARYCQRISGAGH